MNEISLHVDMKTSITFGPVIRKLFTDLKNEKKKSMTLT